MVKKYFCILTAIILLFSFTACTPTEGKTAGETENTSAATADAADPAESTAPTESGEETEPEETEPEVTVLPGALIVQPLPEFSDRQFVWDESKFPTLKSIKIGPNTFTNPDPTEEELANFICKAMFYMFSFDDNATTIVYRIPYDTENIIDMGQTNHGHDQYYQYDPEYVKNIQFIDDIYDSYFPDYSHPTSISSDDDNVYIDKIVADHNRKRYAYDPSLINVYVTEINEATISGYVYYYWEWTSYNDDEETKFPAVGEIEFTALYSETDHIWQLKRFVQVNLALKPEEKLQTDFRDDFGERLTIEKAD